MYQRILAAAAAALVVAAVAGCTIQMENETANPPVIALVTDSSGSTRDLRQPGGLFEQAWLQAATATAERQGILWAGVADGNAVANNRWFVPGKQFKTDLPMDGPLGPAALRRQAALLRPTGRRIMEWRGTAGSDLLGALRNAGRLFGNYRDRPRLLILLTDGGVNVGGIDIYREPPETDADTNRLIQRLKRKNQLADLSGDGPTVQVWIGGLANGVPTAAQATGIVRFWTALIKACNGELVAQDGGALPLVGFAA